MSASSESLAAYQAALTAVESGKAAVNSVFKQVGEASPTLCNINQKASQLQNMTVVRNKGGDVIGYDYKYTTPQLPDTSMMEVNSNTDTGLYATGGGGQTGGGGAGRYNGSKYAGSVVTDPQSTDKMNGSGLVSSNVSPSWAITSVLSKFGKKVAEITADTLERADLHFGVQFGPLSVDSGYGTADAANAIRALFGIDNQGNTTMYLDEDVIGAAGIVARDEGFFEEAETTGATIDLNVYPTASNFASLPILFAPPSKTWRYATSGGRIWARIIEDVHSAQMYYVLVKSESGNYTYVYFISTGAFNCGLQFGYGNYDRITWNSYLNVASGRLWHTDISGTEFYATAAVVGYYDTQEADCEVFPNYYHTTGVTHEELGTIIYDGTIISSGGLPGVSDQPGATVPVDAITGDDPHVVAQNLATNYSQIMGTPVQIVTMDDSCNTVTKNYYSVPISYSPTNLNISAPITGGLQVSPSFNPEVTLDLPDINMDNYIDQVIKIIGGSGAGRDVTTEPTPDTNPDIQPDTPSIDIPQSGTNVTIPDTGSGTTPIVVPPTTDVTSMWHVYSPFDTALSALGSWLWSSSIIDQIVRLFTNPMEAIMGVHAIYAAPDVSSQEPIVVGNLTSTASAPVVTSQYKSLDCGSVWLTEYFGNVFDYEPYTKISLYLPFIGIVPLSVADVMRAKISVSYVIDFYTGACVAKVSVERDGVGGVLYEFPGDCSVKYPVSGASYTGLVQSIVASAMSALRVGMATEGAPGTAALGAAAAGATFVGSGQKISISHSGAFSGNHGAMGSKIPYLIISRPITEMADNFELFDGLPANKQVRLDSCSGYTKCKEVHVVSTGAYKSELDEIERLLRSGVIL